MRHSSIHILTACVALGLSASAASAQTTWVVCWDGSGDFLTIQEGIDAAFDGDEVVVCDGTYTGDGNRDMDFGGKLITVRSENSPENCTIDCDASDGDRHRAFIFQSGEIAEPNDDDPNAVLEGFTIVNGYKSRGGAVNCLNGSGPTIRNCVFEGNTVRGAAEYYTGNGGAIHCDGTGNMLIENCTFLGNTAIGGTVGYRRTGLGGAIACRNTTGQIAIRDCVFRNNIAEETIDESGLGGAILLSFGGKLTLTRCTFVGNSTKPKTGISYPDLGGALLTEGMLPDGTWQWTQVDMMDCVFVGNSSGWGGAWHPTVRTDARVENCIFVGNKTRGQGGAVLVLSADTEWCNCLFAGNFARTRGGALSCGTVYGFQNTVSLSNCALLANHAVDFGGGISTYSNDLVQCDLQNCVVWRNSPDQLEDRTPSALMTVTYSDVQDGTGEAWFGTGCIDADPQFVGGPSGTWTSNGTYEESMGKTTFTDSVAGWDPNELVGKFLRPNVEYEPPDPNDPNQLSGHFQSLIFSNTATSVTVWGDFASLGATGASYEVNDYHVMSDSPCIDTGDPAVLPPGGIDLDGRIRVWDGDDDGDWRVDMGCYEFDSHYPGDVDGDDDVDLADLAQLLGHYGLTSGAEYEDGDLDFDGDVDLADLAALLGVYGTTYE